MKITQQFIDDIKPKGGTWTPRQFEILGVTFPPSKGWRDDVHGMEIEWEQIGELLSLGRGIENGIFCASESDSMVKSSDRTAIWTDGSCHPNPGRGGWAWHDGNGNMGKGWDRHTTNNRMELIAILEAMKAHQGQRVLIHSDSQYCVNGLTIWSAAWRKKGWVKDGEPMKNQDLWMALEKQKDRVDAKFNWVKGHNGDPNNELADRLASEARASAF